MRPDAGVQEKLRVNKEKLPALQVQMLREYKDKVPVFQIEEMVKRANQSKCWPRIDTTLDWNPVTNSATVVPR